MLNAHHPTKPQYHFASNQTSMDPSWDSYNARCRTPLGQHCEECAPLLSSFRQALSITDNQLKKQNSVERWCYCSALRMQRARQACEFCHHTGLIFHRSRTFH
eukprot:GHVN01029754.1.p1 GENE.GHVN01029754.1~~GHVN01029754.1.p1  ORF type:complete len:103 (-),score=0.77 GHVN01029754.1:252-560(-)